MVAEDVPSKECRSVSLHEPCVGFNQGQIDTLLQKFPRVFSQLSGRTDVFKLTIETGDAQPMSLAPYRIPEKFKSGVKLELDKLLEMGIKVVLGVSLSFQYPSLTSLCMFALTTED